MKRILCGALCVIGVLSAGCDMDIPSDQVGTLTYEAICGLTGGAYNQEERRCYCDGVKCGENVSCVLDMTSKRYVCTGYANMEYPEYICTLNNMTVCFDRVIDGRSVGYYVKCDGISWSSPIVCPAGNSCRSYDELGLIPSTECGDCNNDTVQCIRGTDLTK